MNLPNKLTLGRIAAVPIFILLYSLEWYIPSCIIFILASATDFLDGKIARKYGLVTNFGKIMDPLADKMLVYSAFTLMVADHTVPAWTLIVILLREFAIAGMRTVAAADGIVIAAGMSGKIKTALQMAAAPILILHTGDTFYFIGVVIFWASMFMTVYSGTEYILKNKQVFSM